MASPRWAVSRVRFARPTDRLAEVLRFYEEGLGLARIDSFEHHAGYSGVMLGLPGEEYHLEFTEHEDGSPCPAPTRDNLLVLSLNDRDAIAAIDARLRALGYEPVEPENPYWADDLAYEDPDGWGVVLRYVS
ncbi:MAG TPA: VOC family protein [Gaiellaceae bacterium]|nr:VOC family protein [Gaiellaceae bacterium]